jgi:Cofilin/tropomyosin-type actin-binding protein
MASVAVSTSSAPLLSIPPECITAFKELKTKRAFQWLSYKINEQELSLELSKAGKPSNTAVAEMIKSLPEAEGRFLIFDLAVKNSYGGAGSRIYLISYAPSSAGRNNIAYAAQRRALDKAFTGCIDAHAGSKQDIEKLLNADAKTVEEEWDPDA